MKINSLYILLILQICFLVSGAQEHKISLNGEWRFMLDFVNKGLNNG